MRSSLPWVEKKLSENGYSTRRLGNDQLEIVRIGLPNAVVRCVGLDGDEKFDAADLEAAVTQAPTAKFIVVVPTRITHRAYERAEESRICVSGFGELIDALGDDLDISQHIDSQEKYERRRLSKSRFVESLKRRGHHAYTIERRGLRPLTVVTTNDYEFTVDRFLTLLESYEGVSPDLVVVTNPNCHGFSSESRQASDRAGVPLVLLDELLDGLGTEWT